MKVLISDSLSEEGINILKEAGLEVIYKPGLSPEELKKEIAEATALIIRSGTKVTREIIESGKNLKVIGRAGTGLDNVDIQAANERGIVVMNVPAGIPFCGRNTLLPSFFPGKKNSPGKPFSKKRQMGAKKIYGSGIKGENSRNNRAWKNRKHCSRKGSLSKNAGSCL